MVTLVVRWDGQTSKISNPIGYIAVVYQKYTTNFHWSFCTGHDIDVVLIYIYIYINMYIYGLQSIKWDYDLTVLLEYFDARCSV